jgi:hypothetical protein
MTARDRAAAAASDAPLSHMQWIRVRPLLKGLSAGAWLYCRVPGTLDLTMTAIKEALGYRVMDWENVADPDPAIIRPAIKKGELQFYMEANL